MIAENDSKGFVLLEEGFPIYTKSYGPHKQFTLCVDRKMSIWSACILLMGLFKCPTVLDGCEKCWRFAWSVLTLKGYPVRKRTENARH